jgi:hypothetical protein
LLLIPVPTEHIGAILDLNSEANLCLSSELLVFSKQKKVKFHGEMLPLHSFVYVILCLLYEDSE